MASGQLCAVLLLLILTNPYGVQASQELQDFYSQITQLLSEAAGNEDILPQHPVQVTGKWRHYTGQLVRVVRMQVQNGLENIQLMKVLERTDIQVSREVSEPDRQGQKDFNVSNANANHNK